MKRAKLFDSYNAGYAQSLYEEYLRNPASVDETWRRIFAAGGLAEAGLIPVEAARRCGASLEMLRRRGRGRAGGGLPPARPYRRAGGPLGHEPPGHPLLAPEYHGITLEDLASLPGSILPPFAADTMADAFAWLKAIYTGPIGYEYEHLGGPGAEGMAA